MVTFRRATLLFFLLLLCINILRYAGCPQQWISGHFCEHYLLYASLLLFLYLGVSVAMAFVIRSNYHHKAFSRKKTDQRICALTFDDGPHPEFTPKILEILNREGLQATFFIIGTRVAGNEHLLREMDSRGHLIGNHSWSHSSWFDFFPARRMQRELIHTASVISEITGKQSRLFRPPFGVINPMVSKAVTRLNYHVIGWSVRSYDTLHKDPQKIVAQIGNKLRPGSVILLHDHLPYSAEILELLLVELQRRSYRVVPVTELFNINSYA